MKSDFKLVVVAGLAAIVLFILLVVGNQNAKIKNRGGVPEFRRVEEPRSIREEFVVEKIIQHQVDGIDMRSGLYLINHGFMLENLAKVKVEGPDHQSYTLNDVCFKPHTAIFENRSIYFPSHVNKLHKEMRLLSPCLITTPLNCYLDSFRIQKKISNWNSSILMEQLNSRLRNNYIAAAADLSRPYVHSEYGPELIRAWAKHLAEIPGKDTSWYPNVLKWLSSIESHRKTCVDPFKSCDEPTATNFFDICKAFQDFNEFERTTNHKLKFMMDNNRNFTTILDCSKDREKFVEWTRQSEQKGILEAFQPGINVPNHKEIVGQRCEGSFQEHEGVEIFDGERTFGENFSSIHTEIYLMTPEALLRNLRSLDNSRVGESSWTLQQTTELLEAFRENLRASIEHQNSLGSNKDIGVSSEVFPSLEASKPSAPLYILEMSSIIIVLLLILFLILFSVLTWTPTALYSIVSFAMRNAITFGLFLMVGHKDKVIVLDSSLIGLIITHTLVNLFVTTRISFSRYRLHNCVQRLKYHDIRSNFSSIASVSSAEERRQLSYTLAQYTAFQTAQDAYARDKFERLSRGWWAWSLLVLPVAVLYWYLVDATCHLALLVVAPALAFGCLEEFGWKWFYVSQRIQNRKALEKMLIRETTRESDEAVFSGQRQREQQSSEQSLIQRALRVLRKDTYESNPVMKYPNEASRYLRLMTMKFYLQLLQIEAKFGALFCLVALLVVIASGLTLFVPVSRISEEFRIPHQDVYIDVSIEGSFPENSAILKRLNEKIERNVPALRVISNWQNVFERFESTHEENENPQFATWKLAEPLNSAMTASFAELRDNRTAPMLPFFFRIRFDIVEDSANETIMMEHIVQKLSPLLAEHSTRDMTLTPSGAVYAHFQRMADAWNEYAHRELRAAGLFTVLFTIFVLLFVTTPSIPIALSFSLFTVATRLEIAALCSWLSVDNQTHFTNIALISGFLATWHPFCELSRFRSRVLAHEKTKLTPELQSKNRIRVPFIAATDVVQFFSVFLIVLLIFLIVFCVTPPLRVFLQPTVILCVIPLVAFFNSTAVSSATRLMFEQKVRLTLHENLAGATTVVAQVRSFAQKKKRICVPEDTVEMGVIRPTQREAMFAPPPPKYRKIDKKKEEEPESEEEEIDVVTVTEGPGSSSEMLREAQRKIWMERSHEIAMGTPMDSTTRNLEGQFIYHNVLEVANAQEELEMAEENYELDEDEVPLNVDADVRNADEFEVGREEEVVDMLGASGSDEEQEVLQEEVQEEEEEDQEVVVEEIQAPPPPILQIPQIVNRLVPRDPLREPPDMQEYLQANDLDLHPELPVRHPRADQYPPYLTRAMVAYAEDPFWTRRLVPLPPHILVPPRPRDYMRIEERTPPPEDFDYVPAPGGLPIPPEAYELREQRRRQFEEEKKKKKDGDKS